MSTAVFWTHMAVPQPAHWPNTTDFFVDPYNTLTNQHVGICLHLFTQLPLPPPPLPQLCPPSSKICLQRQTGIDQLHTAQYQRSGWHWLLGTVSHYLQALDQPSTDYSFAQGITCHIWAKTGVLELGKHQPVIDNFFIVQTHCRNITTIIHTTCINNQWNNQQTGIIREIN